ncbi:hypothetical protein NPIL_40161 [Nephila pilipes]|uniref:Uncharacterized protein n=1 Tax=Nephila pilipes TaxID=299642 RepID=A0A8X6PYS3_NEPPI|nr:hypothetical protein NPIL_40161 [Nephila pilipes]
MNSKQREIIRLKSFSVSAVGKLQIDGLCSPLACQICGSSPIHKQTKQFIHDGKAKTPKHSGKQPTAMYRSISNRQAPSQRTR